MAIDANHHELSKYSEDYEMVRTILAGDRSVKAAGEKYVPRLSYNTDEEYRNYISRPAFENYTARALDGFVSMAFAKAPIITVPAAMEKIIEDITLSDMHIDDLATELVREVLALNRCGILVDMPTSPSEQLTKAQVEALNIRPYARIYKTESIVNWRTTLVNNVVVTDMVILAEQSETWVDDYTCETETIYRVLIMREGIYTQEIWRKNKDKEWVKDEKIITPMMNGKYLDFIPFFSFTTDKMTLTPSKPPVLDLAVVNMSHFKLMVDFYHGAHFTALPVANFFVSNIDTEKTQIRLGSSMANVFSDVNGHAEFLEFQGSGLSTLSNEKDVLVNRMAALGARFLADDKKVAETSDSQETRSSGERAILILAVSTISAGVTRMLEVMAKWMSVSGDISYELNKDYNLKAIDSQFMKELLTGNQVGAITDKMLYDNFVAGEIIKDAEEYTFDTYMTDREAMDAKMTIQPAQ